MKSIWTLFLALALVGGTVGQAYAQADGTDTEQNDGGKKKKKKNKKKKKKMKKSDMVDAIDDLKNTVAELESEKKTLMDELNQSNQEIQQLENKLSTAENQMEKMREDLSKVGPAAETKGLTFRVQVGAYKSIELTSILKDPKLITAEEVNGVNKYMIGHFQIFSDAKQLEAALKAGGIKDAWLVPYNDGVRITDTEAEKLLGRPIRDKK